MAGKVVTIRDVALRAGVSVSTVSNVLNGQKKVREASRRDVMQAVTELNYRADPAAAYLRTGRSRVVATVVPNLENPFFTSIVAAVERLCQQSGYELIVASSDGLPEIEEARIASLLQWRPAALFVIPSSDDLPCRAEIDLAGVPCVVADRALAAETYDLVELDNVQAGRLAAEHLCDLGHRRIVVLAPSFAVGNIRERLRGINAALEAVGGAAPLLIETRSLRDENAPLVLEPGVFGEATAAIALTNFTTLQLLGALGRLGLRVPHDISLVGFDDLAWMNVASPSITAIRQPVAAMGRDLWDRLLARIDGDAGEPWRGRHTAELVIRESTAPTA